MQTQFFEAGHDWTCTFRMRHGQTQPIVVMLESVLEVRRCEDDHRLTPDETADFLDYCGTGMIARALERHVLRQLNDDQE